MSIKVKLGKRADFGGPSNNLLLSMNGTEGRVSITLRAVNQGAGKKKRKVRAQINWFPPARDSVTCKVFNRMVGKSVASLLLELHANDQGAAYQFALDIVRTEGQSVQERLERRIAEDRANGASFQHVDIDKLSNAPARFVSGGRAG